SCRAMFFFLLLLGAGVSSAMAQLPTATISGTVKGPDGASLKGAFVEARSGQIKNFAIMVLSDQQGQYRIKDLSPGEYRVRALKVGYKATSPTNYKLAEGQSVA